MADGDVAGRLAQGRAAVDDVDVLVRACQHVGYAHPDLTARAGQVGDWYDAEQGLRLDALSADADALRAVAAVAEDAVRRQSDSVAGLSAAWSGRGAGSALNFLARHQHAAVTVGAAVREAAETLTALRDELWRAVDAKVAATLALDVGGRADWLAAAHTVTSGAGDRSNASELVDQQVKPFVDGVVGGRWVGAMRAGTEAVDAAYRAAVTRLQASAGVIFEVPGPLGPPQDSAEPVERSVGAVPAPSVSAGPAAVTAPAAWEPPSAPPVASAPTNPVATEADSQPPITPAAAPSPLGELGGGPSLGAGSAGSGLSGLSGIGQQLADLVGALVGGAGEDASELDLDDPDGSDDLDDLDEDDEDPQDDEEDEPGEERAGEDAAESVPESVPESPPTDPAAAVPEAPVVPGEPAAAVEAAPTPVPAPVPVPPVEVAAAPPEPTPCEIAADELPRVGG